MWAIRILNGSQAGQICVLKEGKNLIGRTNGVDLQLNSAGVSKEHLEITVMGDKILFTDLNSSNGTFLNGTKVKGGILKLGDKLSVHNVIIDLIVATEKLNSRSAESGARAGLPKPPPNMLGASVRAQTPATYQQGSPAPFEHGAVMPFPSAESSSDAMDSFAIKAAPPKRTLPEKINDYLNRVVLPAMYDISEQFEFRMVLMVFVGIYVVLVTLLAIIPMKQITGDSIAIESRRRAVTVARSLAKGNERVVRSGDIANYSTDFALKEEGVDDVYVVSAKDGRIMAPPERVGSPPHEAGFFKNVVLKAGNHESSGEVDGKVAAATPILGYDPDTQQNVALAYAVVIYNPGSLTFDDGRVFSLFIQMLALALVAGGILFFFLYRLIEYPFLQLNGELDAALRENREQVSMRVKLPALQNMLINVNSLLVRAAHASSHSGHTAASNWAAKEQECLNLIRLIGFPALLINREGIVLKCNSTFLSITGWNLNQVENQKISSLPDQALQKNIFELMKASLNIPGEVAMDKLEIGGQMFTLNCQSITGGQGEVECHFLTISPMEGAEGSAA